MEHFCSLGVIAVALAVVPQQSTAQASGDATPQATAQTAPEETPENVQSDDREIIVTARRRNERLQAVPLAITALSGEALTTQNVTKLENIGNVAPGLTVAPAQGRASQPGFAIRGQRQDASFITNDPSVGVYVAEAVQARMFGLGQSLFDLESIQVLKGPQGTLFGRNTTGGAILIQTRRPELDEVSGYGQARYGNFNRFDLQGAINVPLADGLAVRIAYNRTRREGYVTNVTSGEKLSGEHTDTIRGTLLFQPHNDFSNTLYVDYFRADTTQTAARTIAVNPAGNAQRLFNALATFQRQQRELGFWETEGDVPTYSRGTNFGVTNVTTGRISDHVDLKAILNYRRIKASDALELDGTNAPLLYSVEDQNTQQMTAELQLQGKALNDKFTYIAGLYYFIEDGSRLTLTSAFGAAINPRLGEATNLSRSLFLQGDYKLADTLTLTLGGRYTWDKRGFRQQLRNGVTGACLFCASAETDFSALTYTSTLSWQVDADRLIYVAHRRGYRSGGFNSSATIVQALTPFRPETVTDFELGFKSDWDIGPAKLRSNIAVFRTLYDDIQRTTFVNVDNVPVNSIFNAAAATIDGVEAEFVLSPSSQIELSAGAAYSDPRYTSFQFVDPILGPTDQSANRFAFIPKYTYRVGATINLPLDRIADEVSANITYNWQSKVFFAEINSANSVGEARGLMAARIELKNIASTGVSAAVWGNNILNKKYFVSGSDFFTGLGYVNGQIGEPRTYGLEVSLKF